MTDRRSTKRRIEDIVEAEVYKQNQASMEPLSRIANNFDIRLSAQQTSLDNHIEVYKNNGKEWKSAKEEMEKFSTLLKEVSEKLNTLTTDTAPAVSFTKNAIGFKGIIDIVKDNIWPIGVVLALLIYAIKAFI